MLLRAADLFAPGYEVVDVRARGGDGEGEAGEQGDGGGEGGGGEALWDRELGVLRVGGVEQQRPGLWGTGKGLLCQVAVVTFWNRHLRCGFLVRILVEPESRMCFVDLGKAAASLEASIAEAKRVWEKPGSVEVSVPVSGTKDEPPTRRTIRVNVVSPRQYEAEEPKRDSRDRGWMLRPGYDIKLAASVTFTEKWEKEYQRTVQAKVERKKKGIIELSMSSILWQAAPAA